ncbi:MAG TPA: hypothetical protein VN648_09825, partial [Candidatus Methylomirabilis sp.]|nr:hypothetical protein [Candidatus Methylomirabilis sp.]
PIAEVFFRQAELTFPLALGMVGACGISLLQFNQTALQAFRAYGRHAVVVLVRYTVILVPLILLATINRLGLTSTLVVNIGAPFLVFTLSLSYASVGISRGAGNPLALLPQIWHLSKWVVVINLCSMFFSRLEIYFLTAFASPTELGIYSAAVKLCGGMLILEVAVRTVLFPEISRRASMPGDLASFTRRSVVALGLVTGIVYGLGLLASPFIPVLVGERYAASVPIFLIVLAARAAVIPLVPLSLLFYPTNSTRAGAVFAATQLVVLVVFGLILVPTYGAAGAAWTSVLVSLAGWLYLGLFARSYLTGLRLPVRVSAEQVS